LKKYFFKRISWLFCCQRGRRILFIFSYNGELVNGIFSVKKDELWRGFYFVSYNKWINSWFFVLGFGKELFCYNLFWNWNIIYVRHTYFVVGWEVMRCDVRNVEFLKYFDSLELCTYDLVQPFEKPSKGKKPCLCPLRVECGIMNNGTHTGTQG
jgi:hypothetical protein